MNNWNFPCLRNACWCKDDTLPPIGSLWEYKDPRLPKHGEGIYRVDIRDNHNTLFCEHTDDSKSDMMYIIHTEFQPQHNAYRTQCFKRDFKTHVPDEV